MASRGYAALPAYQYPGNAMINFQPITQAVDKFRAGMDAKYEGDAQREFANAMASGDTNAAQAAIGKIDPKMALETGMYPGKRAAQDIDLRMKEAQELGGRAQSILDMPDGPEKIAAANQWFQSDPRFQATFQKRGMTNWREDPLSVVRAIHGEALGALDPTKRAGQYGLTPIYGTDAEGNVAIAQLNSRGGARGVAMPPGFTPGEPVKNIDLGTTVVQQGGKTGRAVGAPLPKDVRGKEREEEVGKAEGKSIADAPRVIDNANLALDTVRQIREHPGRSYGFQGWFAEKTGGVPNTDQRGYVALLKQARGKAFLEAYNALRGGGQITEVEGAKATDALVRMDSAQREEDFIKALDDFEAVIKIGRERAQRATGAGGAAPKSSGRVGEIPDGQPGSRSSPVIAPTPQAAAELPSGTWFRTPDGQLRQRK